MDVSDLVSFGSAGAVVATVALFLTYLRRHDARIAQELAEMRKQLLNIIVNDCAHVAERLSEVGESLQEVLELLRKMNGKKGGLDP